MSEQHFIPRDFSLSPTDLLPPEDLDDGAADAQWAEYARTARTVPTDDVMLAVAELFSNSPALRAMIEDVKRAPFEPGERRHLHISDAMKLGDEIALLIDQAMDDAVGMRQAGRAA